MDLVELTAVFFCVFAKHTLHGPGLDGVAQRRGSAVRVDVIDLLGIDLRIANRRAHHAVGAVAIVSGRGDVMRVARHSVAHHFRQNICAAPLRVLE